MIKRTGAKMKGEFSFCQKKIYSHSATHVRGRAARSAGSTSKPMYFSKNGFLDVGLRQVICYDEPAPIRCGFMPSPKLIVWKRILDEESAPFSKARRDSIIVRDAGTGAEQRRFLSAKTRLAESDKPAVLNSHRAAFNGMTFRIGLAISSNHPTVSSYPTSSTPSGLYASASFF